MSTSSQAEGKQLNVTYTPSKSTVTVGESFTLTLRIENISGSPITQGGITLESPVNYAGYGVWCVKDTANDCDNTAWMKGFGPLAVGEVKTFTKQFIVNSNATKTGSVSWKSPLVFVNNENKTGDYSGIGFTITTVLPTVTPSPSPLPTQSPTKTPAVTTPAPTKKPIQTPSDVPLPTLDPTENKNEENPDEILTITTTNEIKLPEIFTKDGNKTTQITELTEYENPIFENVEVSKVEFREKVSFTNEELISNLDKAIDLSQKGKISVDTNKYPELNKKAHIVLKGLSFKSTPEILRNGEKAGDYVSNVTYDTKTGTLEFDVKGFSTYEAVEKKSNNTTAIIASIIIVIILAGLSVFVYRKYGTRLKKI